MMGLLVVGRNDAGAVRAAAVHGWMWRMWHALFARPIAGAR
jgi:hypothetical protein